MGAPKEALQGLCNRPLPLYVSLDYRPWVLHQDCATYWVMLEKGVAAHSCCFLTSPPQVAREAGY